MANNDLTQQVSELRLRLGNETALENKIKQQLVLFVMLSAEIDSLRKRVQES